MKLVTKLGSELAKREVVEINLAKKREFGAFPLSKLELKSGVHFLLKEKSKLLAFGSMVPIDNVKFNDELFSIWGIGGIVANIKRKGYGCQIMTAIKNNLKEEDKTGVGFCMMKNKDFYEKCGYDVDAKSIKRFIYYDNGSKITENGDDCVLYFDSSDNFMKKVLENPKLDIILPRPPNW